MIKYITQSEDVHTCTCNYTHLTVCHFFVIVGTGATKLKF